jgi:hypothetical protein
LLGGLRRQNSFQRAHRFTYFGNKIEPSSFYGEATITGVDILWLTEVEEEVCTLLVSSSF